MSLRRRGNTIHRFSPDHSNTTSRILRTAEELSLVRDEVILVGSAALALYGVYLAADPLRPTSRTPRPGDADFVSTLGYAQHLAQEGTPTGLVGRRKPNVSGPPILQIATRELSADIIPHNPHASDRMDQQFRERIDRESVEVDGSNLRVATPQKLAQELRGRARVDRKAASDLNALRQHFTDL